MFYGFLFGLNAILPLDNETQCDKKCPQGKTLVVHLHNYNKRTLVVNMVAEVTIGTFVTLVTKVMKNQW
jgi:hypothetical protein